MMGSPPKMTGIPPTTRRMTQAVEEEEEEEEKEEALVEEVDNITETIPSGFTPMLRNKKRRLNCPTPNTIMEDDEEGGDNDNNEGSNADQ